VPKRARSISRFPTSVTLASSNHKPVNQGTRVLPWLSVALALMAGISLWSMQQWRRSPMGRLAAAAPREVRFVEARVSGGFRWAPLARRTPNTRMLPLLAAASGLGYGSDERDVRHSAAVTRLFTDHVATAIAQLASIAEQSRDPGVWNDLGAAHYEAAVRSDSAEHLKEALASVDQALLFDPAFAEALFNRALVLEHYHLRDVAAAAWRHYLGNAANDGWREEAQRHLDALTAPQRTFATEIGKQYPHLQAGDRAAARMLVRIDAGDARSFAETEGLAWWGEAWLRRDPAAERHLTAMRTLGAELAAFNGEALLRDSVAAVDRADDQQRDALARGHIGYRDGCLADAHRRMADEEKILSDAVRELASGGSPLAGEVRLYTARAKFWQGRHAEAEADLRALLPVVPERYIALRANLDWQLASCFMVREDTGNSLALLARAIETFTRLHETNNVAYLHDITSQVYDGVRDHQRAERHRGLALQELGKVSNDRLVHAINGMTYAARKRKEWRAARSFLTVQLAVNATANDAEVQTVALLLRARLHDHLGDHRAADSDLRAAAAVAASVQDSAHRAKLQTDCDAATALITNDPRTAIPLLTDVLKFHAEKGWEREMPELYLRRGRMHLALGDHLAAAADFESGIALIESHREKIQQGEQRWGILDDAEELFDEAIAEALRSGAEPAFTYAERERARTLSDRLLENVRTFDRTLLPPDTLLVEYAALPERLLIIAVDRNGIEAHEVPIGRAQLTSLAGEFTAALRGGDAQRRRKVASQLSEPLLTPIRRHIATHGEIAFVTDATTSAIAFAALPGAAPGRMLVEDVTISVAPSARLYLASRLRKPRPRSNALIVDTPENPALERLAGTNEEAKAVQAEYPHARRLTGPDATRTAFVKESRDANVIHFGGHGVSSVEFAALVLTATPGDSGFFDAASISRLSLPNIDVVVLAACDTARGPVRSAEGVLSVTHAFLQAGAPAVIATLWPLDDRAAARFFPVLHHYLARGFPAPDALRLAQIEAIRSSAEDRTASWAAVQAIGY
jgi:CHAT domain-containing protein